MAENEIVSENGSKTGNAGGLTCFNPSGDPTALSANWKRWIRAFNIFLCTKKITDNQDKLNLLLHTGGLNFQDLYYSLVPENQPMTYEESINILNKHMVPKSNESFERHLFRQMCQANGETIAQFVGRLRIKAATCHFHKIDEAIRDQLIDKCRNHTMRRKFLEETGTINLTDLESIARAHEAVDQQMWCMQNSEPQTQVNAVNQPKSFPRRGRRSGSTRNISSSGSNSSSNKMACYRCGGVGHLQRDNCCPARSNTCSKCGFKGHFAEKCRTLKLRNRTYNVDNLDNEDDSDINVVGSGNTDGKSNLGTATVRVGGVTIENMLIDSGDSCNIIDKQTWDGLKSKNVQCKSSKTSKRLFAYGQSEPIETLGTLNCIISCDKTDIQTKAEIVVITGQGKSILGKITAEKLNLLRVGPPINFVNTVIPEGTDQDIHAKFPDLFKGIGKLNDFKLNLHIDKTVKPVAQPIRRLPFGLREKVDEKLDELLANDIIEEVSGPTQWVSLLVVVPKPGGDVRICVDMRQANKAIIRERHPIPTIEEILYKMNGATVFSKVDLKWGFHRIPLSDMSRDITTFTTHRGLYRYKRLMFGINSAPECYQKIISDLLRDCAGVTNIADDIIVFGNGVKSHDESLFKAFEVLKSANLTVNKTKCEFRLPKLTFFGQDFNKDGVSSGEKKIGAVTSARPPKNRSEIRSFLALVQYSAKFLPDLAQISEPLRMLTRKNVDFKWELDQQMAFDKLKQLVTDSKTLAYFKNDCRTRVVADAGPTGIGAVLTQSHGESWCLESRKI